MIKESTEGDYFLGHVIYTRGNGVKNGDNRDFFFPLPSSNGDMILWATEEEATIEIEQARIRNLKESLSINRDDFILVAIYMSDDEVTSIPLFISEDEVLEEYTKGVSKG